MTALVRELSASLISPLFSDTCAFKQLRFAAERRDAAEAPFETARTWSFAADLMSETESLRE